MFPWYSGTSADMYRTVFGLVVSLKLFLGRFDIRTMQARQIVWLPSRAAAPLPQQALRCVALRCVALRCVALRCVALRCVALRCVALR
jgi:hypothetical protein